MPDGLDLIKWKELLVKIYSFDFITIINIEFKSSKKIFCNFIIPKLCDFYNLQAVYKLIIIGLYTLKSLQNLFNFIIIKSTKWEKWVANYKRRLFNNMRNYIFAQSQGKLWMILLIYHVLVLSIEKTYTMI